MTTRKSHAVLLIEQWNKANPDSKYHVDADGVTVGQPQANTTERAGEVMVLVTALPNNAKFAGTHTLTYDRYDLTELFATVGVTDLDVIGHNVNTTRELWDELAEQYDWDIRAEDILDEPIVQDEDGIAAFELKASPNSLFYRGEIGVIYTNDPNVPLSSVIMVTQLNGFNPPAAPLLNT